MQIILAPHTLDDTITIIVVYGAILFLVGRLVVILHSRFTVVPLTIAGHQE